MTEHTGFILAAFLATGAVLLGLIAATLVDYRIQRRALARLAPEPDDRVVRP